MPSTAATWPWPNADSADVLFDYSTDPEGLRNVARSLEHASLRNELRVQLIRKAVNARDPLPERIRPYWTDARERSGPWALPESCHLHRTDELGPDTGVWRWAFQESELHVRAGRRSAQERMQTYDPRLKPRNAGLHSLFEQCDEPRDRFVRDVLGDSVDVPPIPGFEIEGTRLLAADCTLRSDIRLIERYCESTSAFEAPARADWQNDRRPGHLVESGMGHDQDRTSALLFAAERGVRLTSQMSPRFTTEARCQLA